MNSSEYTGEVVPSYQGLPQKQTLVAERDKNVIRLLEAADDATNRTFLATCANNEIVPFQDHRLAKGVLESIDQISLYRISRLVYGADENPADKLKALFLGLSGLKHHPSVFYVLQNRCTDVNSGHFEFALYVGVKPLRYEDKDSLRELFHHFFDGIFLGSQHSKPLSNETVEAIRIRASSNTPHVVCVTAQPSVKKNADGEAIDQGLEQFIDVMRSQNYTAVLLATPVDKPMIEKRKRELENLHSRLTLFQKVNLSFGENESESIGENISQSVTLSESTTLSETTSRSSSHSTSTSRSSSSSTSGQGWSSGGSSSYSESDTIGFSSSTGTSLTTGRSVGDSRGTSNTRSTGSSVTYAVEAQNKSIVDLLARLDETLKKLSNAETFGLWECAAYFISSRESMALFAANAFKGLILGDESADERSHTICWPYTKDVRQQYLLRSILSGVHPTFINQQGIFRKILPTNFVSGDNLPFFLPLPHKSVPDLAVDTVAAFGRSVAVARPVVTEKKKDGTTEQKKPKIVLLGNVYHMYHKELPVELDLNGFTSHCFITGSTGSGKSNTTELLIERCIEKKIKFLIVEPAKGEYKKAFKNVPGISIFTTHPLCETLLRINPFAFPKGIHVLEHIDRLLGIFSSCWELTAAMPAILKKSVESAYQKVGWDLPNSYFIGTGDTRSVSPRYPTFSTLVTELQHVIQCSDYSAEAKGNYTGALVTRVESLTAGVLRQVFCGVEAIPAETLFDSETIVDLSRLGSEETKNLIMGVLIMQLSEHRQTHTKGTNKDIQHLTVIEEAHNLLRNSTDMGAGGSTLVKKSVEAIANAIAEMRTYGEGFMIVDQSPTSVDISAIKNTNTKIVMRLPEQHDCEAIASAMGLDEQQTRELSRLSPGTAVVMQNSWISAVLTVIAKSSGKYKGEEEWTDADFNRRLRARLALAVGNLGYNRARYYTPRQTAYLKSDFEKLPSLKVIEDIIDKTVEKRYEQFVGAARMDEINKSHLIPRPRPARAHELHTIFAYHEQTYHLSSCSSVSTNKIGYGRLALALLGCDTCWRAFLALPDSPQRRRSREDFATIMRAYIPLDILEKHTRSFNNMFTCICRVLEYDGIVQSGGTSRDLASFCSSIRRKRSENPYLKFITL